MVEGRDDREPLGGGDLLRPRTALDRGGALEDDFGPEPGRAPVLHGRAVVGITTTARTPRMRAASATPWAWLPEE